MQENSDSLSPVKFSLDIALVWFSHPFFLGGSSFSLSPLGGRHLLQVLSSTFSFPFTCCPGTTYYNCLSPALICFINSSFMFPPTSKTLSSRGLITSSKHVKKFLIFPFEIDLSPFHSVFVHITLTPRYGCHFSNLIFNSPIGLSKTFSLSDSSTPLTCFHCHLSTSLPRSLC